MAARQNIGNLFSAEVFPAFEPRRGVHVAKDVPARRAHSKVKGRRKLARATHGGVPTLESLGEQSHHVWMLDREG